MRNSLRDLQSPKRSLLQARSDLQVVSRTGISFYSKKPINSVNPIRCATGIVPKLQRFPIASHRLTKMNHANDNEGHDSAPKKRLAIFPWLALLTVAALMVGLNIFDSALAEAFNLDPAIKHIASFLLPSAFVVSVGLWYLIRRARSLNLKTAFAVLAVLLPVGFFVFMEPVFGGNANLLGFKSRLRRGETEIAEREASSEISRLIETEFDFPQFLGPDRNGIVSNVKLASWKDSPPELLWAPQKVGDAWSGFAVVNGFAITQEQRGERECVVCYEIQSGNTVWTYAAERRHEDYAGFGRVGPRATPSVDAGDVYAVGATGILDCLDGEDGELKWTYDIAANCGIDHTVQTNSRGFAFSEETSSLAWGRSQSPLIVGDLVIVAGGGVKEESEVTSASTKDGSFVNDRRVTSAGATLIAIDKVSGEEVWRGGNRPVAYGSPVLATVAGVEQLLLVAEDHCVGHDPKTGEELWAFPWDGQSDGAANCSQVTVIDNDHLLITKGYSIGAQVLKLQQEEQGGIRVVALKQDPRVLKTKFSNPVIRDGYAYAVSDRFLECVEVMTLKKKWRRRGFQSGQLLLVGDKLLAHSEDGELFLVAALPDEYRELGSIKTVTGTCWNTLTLSKDLVLVRSEQEAVCFRLPLEE